MNFVSPLEVTESVTIVVPGYFLAEDTDLGYQQGFEQVFRIGHHAHEHHLRFISRFPSA